MEFHATEYRREDGLRIYEGEDGLWWINASNWLLWDMKAGQWVMIARCQRHEVEALGVPFEDAYRFLTSEQPLPLWDLDRLFHLGGSIG